MSPSPATGLSKGEREREINSTSFGECKTVPRMYLCLVMSCSGVIAALWRGALHHQGSLAGPYAKVSHEGAKYLLYCVLASSGFRRRGGGGYRVPLLFMSLSVWLVDGAVALASPSIPPHGPRRTLLTTFAALSKWSGLIQDEHAGKFYPFGLLTCFSQKVSDMLEIRSRCKEATNDSWRPFFICFQ